MIHLEIPGAPIPWQSSRVSSNGMHYNPKGKEKQAVKELIRFAYKEKPLEEPVALLFGFYMPIAESETKRIKIAKKVGDILHTGKPDTTNLQKFYEDCLSGIVIVDDRYVCYTRSFKIYSENPRTKITVIPEQLLRTRRKFADG